MSLLTDIGGLGSAAAGVVGTIGGLIQNKQALRNARKMADYQFDLNKKMWDMQNEYNSPSSQIQRYQEAGLNPNLIYGSGSAAAGNSTSLPQAEQPGYLAPYMGFEQLGPQFDKAVNTAREILDSAEKRRLVSQQTVTEQNKLHTMTAEIVNKNADTLKKYQETHNAKLAGQLQEINLRYQDTLKQQEQDINDARIDLILANKDESLTRKLTEQFKQANLQSESELNAANTALARVKRITESALTDYYRASSKLKNGEYGTIAHRVSLLDTQVREADNHATYLYNLSLKVLQGDIPSQRAETLYKDYMRTTYLPEELKIKFTKSGSDMLNSLRNQMKLKTKGLPKK